MIEQHPGPALILDPYSSRGQQILKALSSEKRLRILDFLRDKPRNVSEISEALNFPLSTANMHISALEKAGLLITDLHPGERGLQKLCARAYTTIVVQFPQSMPVDETVLEMTMPIGSFINCDIKPTCGLADEQGIIGMLDDPASFYDPDRSNAQLLWFHQGSIEYRFPNRIPQNSQLDSIQVSMELCSEAPLHHDDYPSDITLSINDIELGTWTSPADFGGQRGILTPSWWETSNTQYGLLKMWKTHQTGSYIDGMRISDVNIAQLDLYARNYISVKLEIKSDAKNIGGVNIFGRSFGNYPQDIVMVVRYRS